MPWWMVVFCASALEFLTMYFLYTIPEQGNKIKAGYLAGMVAVLSLLSVLLSHFNVPFHTVAVVAVFIGMLRLANGQRWRNIISDMMISCGLYAALQIIVTILIGRVYGNIMEIYSLLFLFLMLFLGLAYFGSQNAKITRFVQRVYSSNRDVTIWIAVNLFILSVFVINLYSKMEEIFWNAQGLLVLVVINYILNIVLLFSVLRKRKLKNEALANQKHIESLEQLMYQLSKRKQEHSENIKEIMEIVRQTVEALLTEKVMGFCEMLLEREKGQEIEPDFCGSSMIAALLFQKSKLAEAKGIHFEYSIDANVSHFPVEEYVLAELIGAMTEIAFDLAVNLAKEDKVIWFKLLEKKVQVSLAMADQREGYIRFQKSAGYGMKKMSSLIRRNRGVIEIYTENDLLVFQGSF